MPLDSTIGEDTQERAGRTGRPKLAVACGVLGVVAAVWAYWMIVPGVVFGIAAVALGLHVRRGGSRDAGTIAVTLGIVALLLVPSVIALVDMAEDYGRECALNPTRSDC